MKSYCKNGPIYTRTIAHCQVDTSTLVGNLVQLADGVDQQEHTLSDLVKAVSRCRIQTAGHSRDISRRIKGQIGMIKLESMANQPTKKNEINKCAVNHKISIAESLIQSGRKKKQKIGEN